MNLNQILKSSPAFILPAVINLLTLLVLTRSLSLNDYGKLSLAMITIEFSQGIIFQWIKLAMVRFYNSDKKSDSLSLGLHFSMIMCLMLFLGFFLFFHPYFCDIDKVYILFIILGIIGRGFFYFLLDFIRMTNNDLKKYTIVSLVSNIFYCVPALVYVFFVKVPQINSILGIQALGIMLYMLIISIKKYKIIIVAFKDYKEKLEYIEFIKYGAPLILVFLASSAFVRIDRFIIEHNLGLAQLGSYSAAYSLSNLAISSFFSIITLPTYPEIIRKLNIGETLEAKKIYQNNGNLILAIGVPIVIGCFFLNEFLCNIFFGNKGSKIVLIFPYVVVGTFLLNFKTHYFDQIFQFAKKTKFLMGLGIFIGSIHFCLSYYLSNIYGAKGVAISVAILNAVAILFIYFYSKSFFKIIFNFKVVIFISILFMLSILTYILKKYI
jgi:O-antigen/teichoic acid export membrane protein